MKTLSWIVGIVFVLVGLAILLFAEGLRRYYSGLFFVTTGALTLVTTARRGEGPKHPTPGAHP